MEADLKDIGFKLEKALLEVRFNQTFLFDELQKINYIAKKLRKEFPHSQRDPQNGALILVNPTEKTIVATLPDRVSVDSNNPVPFSSFKNLVIRSIDVTTSILEVEEFNRVGLRLFFGQSMDSPEKSNEIIKDKFLKITESEMNSNIFNPQVIFSTFEGQYGVNICIRSETNVSVQFSDSTQMQNISHNLVFDIDVFQQNTMKLDNLNSFIKYSSELAMKKLRSLVEIARR
ncbi:hypothetical protein [Collibacillus ludicampi]|nr:hypothetical protein [Collibacillus ludicampi]